MILLLKDLILTLSNALEKSINLYKVNYYKIIRKGPLA